MERILNRICFVKNKTLHKWFWLKNIFSKNIGVSGSTPKNLVISLTTYPARLRTVYLTIESLMSQSLKPDAIVLWLSKTKIKEEDIPKNILRLKSRGLEVRFVDENLKSYKKLIYSLRSFDKATIVTCDDDVLYPSYFLSGLVEKNKEFPDCITAYRCTEITRLDDGSIQPYLAWPAARTRRPSLKLFPTGVGGILYPPRVLHPEVFNKSVFLELAPLADDIWFKAMSLLNTVPIAMVKDKSVEFPIISGSQKSALWHENNVKGRNDEQFHKVFRFYNLYDKLIN